MPEVKKGHQKCQSEKLASREERDQWREGRYHTSGPLRLAAGQRRRPTAVARKTS